MRNYRLGKDLTIKIAVMTNGQPMPLDGRDLTLVLYDPLGISIPLDFTTKDNMLTARYMGTRQKLIGNYRLTLWENKDQSGQTVTDFCKAFRLVLTTCEEGGEDPEGLDSEVVGLTGNIAVGVQGEPFRYEDFTEEQLAELKKPALDAAIVCEKATKAAVKAVADLPTKSVIQDNVNDVTI